MYTPSIYLYVYVYIYIYVYVYTHVYTQCIYVENSALATGLKKVSFHSNSKERQSQRILKLTYDCSHLTR